MIVVQMRILQMDNATVILQEEEAARQSKKRPWRAETLTVNPILFQSEPEFRLKRAE